MPQATKSTCAFAAASMLLAAPALAAGTSAGTTFDVKITISTGCAISNDNAAVDFGAVSGASAKPAAKTKTATITCTSGTPYDFHVSSANSFKMKDSGGNTIPYTIKAGASTAALGSAQVTTGFTQTGTGSAQAVIFNFDISTWNTSAPYASGIYTDTVTLNVDF